MTLVPHPPDKEALRQRLKTLLDGHQTARSRVLCAREVVIFGSVARGTDGPSSDLDVLAIGEGERLKTRYLDLVFANAESTQDRRWLGAELANHVATYGVWLAGEPDWTERIYTSDLSMRRKQLRILKRLSGAYVNRGILNLGHAGYYLEKVLLDSLRLELLQAGRAIPSTSEIRSVAVEDKFSVVDRLPQIIGDGPNQLFVEIARSKSAELPRVLVRELFDTAWRDRQVRHAEWREAGRPGLEQRV